MLALENIHEPYKNYQNNDLFRSYAKCPSLELLLAY